MNDFVIKMKIRGCLRERPFNLKGEGVGGLWSFFKKNILIPNVAEKIF